jgi:hypothetical protein
VVEGRPRLEEAQQQPRTAEGRPKAEEQTGKRPGQENRDGFRAFDMNFDFLQICHRLLKKN